MYKNLRSAEKYFQSPQGWNFVTAVKYDKTPPPQTKAIPNSVWKKMG